MSELKKAVMKNEPATDQLAQLIAERDVYLLHAQKTEQRAEAAEARAADAEIRAKSWRDSAMTLADQRDELVRKLEQALNREQMDRAVMTEASAKIDELRQEARDSANRIVTLMDELAQAKRELNHYHRLQADIDMGVIVLEYPRSDEE